jgi:hypothetical protein
MDTETRAEIEKLHGRINEMGNRLTVLETNIPHINAALARIQGGVDKLVWAVALLFLGVVFKFVVEGGFTKL